MIVVPVPRDGPELMKPKIYKLADYLDEQRFRQTAILCGVRVDKIGRRKRRGYCAYPPEASR